MRFIQMWFIPSEKGLKLSVEQRAVDQKDRTNRLLLLVSNEDSGYLRIFLDAKVYSSFLQTGQGVRHEVRADRGIYLYVLEGGPVGVNDHLVSALSAAKITGKLEIDVEAQRDAELLLVEVGLYNEIRTPSETSFDWGGRRTMAEPKRVTPEEI